MAARNMHATALVLGDRGVVISGGSGSGKSSLALALLARFGGNGVFARLVSDDQIFLDAAHAGRAVCSAPPTISGLIEVRGIGPQAVPFERAAVVDLLIRLVPEGTAERFPEDSTAMLAGCPIACIDLAERDAVGAVAAVAARLRLPPFA